ncbi:hypothetical protein CAEBREN_03673 [Caenorhabditis brenneri]|uniref:Uncharacterized protein n=1 Tax=Caenorhabditis brenneri TaxID=135651 RepID=G0NY91_CAEBE|nr:hypothetical protein CAEBREN_03673 [Caenorhabditis brenneri]
MSTENRALRAANMLLKASNGNLKKDATTAKAERVKALRTQLAEKDKRTSELSNILSEQKCNDQKVTKHVGKCQKALLANQIRLQKIPLKIEEWYILFQTFVDNTINAISHVDEDVQIVSRTDIFICAKIFLEEMKKMISSFCEHSDQIKMLVERIDNKIGDLERTEKNWTYFNSASVWKRMVGEHHTGEEPQIGLQTERRDQSQLNLRLLDSYIEISLKAPETDVYSFLFVVLGQLKEMKVSKKENFKDFLNRASNTISFYQPQLSQKMLNEKIKDLNEEIGGLEQRVKDVENELDEERKCHFVGRAATQIRNRTMNEGNEKLQAAHSLADICCLSAKLDEEKMKNAALMDMLKEKDVKLKETSKGVGRILRGAVEVKMKDEDVKSKDVKAPIVEENNNAETYEAEQGALCFDYFYFFCYSILILLFHYYSKFGKRTNKTGHQQAQVLPQHQVLLQALGQHLGHPQAAGNRQPHHHASGQQQAPPQAPEYQQALRQQVIEQQGGLPQLARSEDEDGRRHPNCRGPRNHYDNSAQGKFWFASLI